MPGREKTLYQQTYSDVSERENIVSANVFRRQWERKHCISKRIQTSVREKTLYQQTYSDVSERENIVSANVIQMPGREKTLYQQTYSTRQWERKHCISKRNPDARERENIVSANVFRRQWERKHCISKRIQTSVREKTLYQQT